MHRALHHHGCTTGCSLWVVITVALGLALGQQATAATECARDPAAYRCPPHRAWCRGARGRGTVCGSVGGGVGRLRWALPCPDRQVLLWLFQDVVLWLIATNQIAHFRPRRI
jgi:hypothetical protein